MDVCFHCNIVIDPELDEAHQVEIDGELETICDACDNDFRRFGDTFGDGFYQRELGWSGCCHKQWAEEETTIRKGMSIA